jgi:hypothetical protein
LFSAEALKFHVDTWQCKHVLLACCYDTGYLPYLGQFAGEKRLSSRITLIEGSLPLSKLKDIGFRTIQLDNIFDTEQRRKKQQTIQSLPKPLPASQCRRDPNARPERLGPILRDTHGKRRDKPLSVRSEVMKQFEKANVCPWFFLRGQCRVSCSRNHGHRPLTDEELDAVWLIARRGRCYTARKDNHCDDDRCVYGHF